MVLYLIGYLRGNLNQRKPALLHLLPSVNQIKVWTSLTVSQWLGLLAFTAEGASSIPGWGPCQPKKETKQIKGKDTALL